MFKFLKNKLFYPIIAILIFFVFTILVVINLDKTAISDDRIYLTKFDYPGTRWMENDNSIGASKRQIKKNNELELKIVDFPKEISIPELPPLPDIPLTEEDK